MTKKTNILAFAFSALAVAGTVAGPLGPGFTYQGHLNDGGAPATGSYDMIFNLYDDSASGNVLGTFSIFGAVPVTNGLFTVELNANGEFGTNAFNGQSRWLQIGVRTNSNNAMNPWVTLSPRQPVHSAPQAWFAQNAGSSEKANLATTVADGAITGSKLANGSIGANNLAPGTLDWANLTSIPAGFADGVDNGTTYTAGAGLTLSAANELSVKFGASGAADTAARSDHQHFGTKWSGDAWFGTGLSVTNTSGSFATAIYGQQGDGSGFPYFFGGVSAGVWGESSQGSGVYGATGYENGNGVFGYAAKASGNSAGVNGQSVSTSGAGVSGLAQATTGKAVGVRGESKALNGSGVTGIASSPWGDATGVYGETAALNGAGVFGKATYINGVSPSYGVVGQSDSPSGYGVVARNTNGVALKVEGSGTIQSDADSWVFIPGTAGIGAINDAAVERDPWKLTLKDYFFSDNAVHYPITIPGSLYGQDVMLKAIYIFYRVLDTNYGTITYTRLVESKDPATSTVLINDSKPHSSSQGYALNHPLGPNSGFLTLELIYELTGGEGFPGVDIYGIKLRLGHK